MSSTGRSGPAGGGERFHRPGRGRDQARGGAAGDRVARRRLSRRGRRPQRPGRTTRLDRVGRAWRRALRPPQPRPAGRRHRSGFLSGTEAAAGGSGERHHLRACLDRSGKPAAGDHAAVPGHRLEASRDLGRLDPAAARERAAGAALAVQGRRAAGGRPLGAAGGRCEKARSRSRRAGHRFRPHPVRWPCPLGPAGRLRGRGSRREPGAVADGTVS